MGLIDQTEREQAIRRDITALGVSVENLIDELPDDLRVKLSRQIMQIAVKARPAQKGLAKPAKPCQTIGNK